MIKKFYDIICDANMQMRVKASRRDDGKPSPFDHVEVRVSELFPLPKQNIGEFLRHMIEEGEDVEFTEDYFSEKGEKFQKLIEQVKKHTHGN